MEAPAKNQIRSQNGALKRSIIVKNLSATPNISHLMLAAMAAFLFVTSGIAGAQAAKTYHQIAEEHPGWVQVPGQLTRPDCVHQIPAGANVEISDDPRAGDNVTLNGEVIAHYDPCPEAPIDTRHPGHAPGPTGNGWVEHSQWDVPLKSGDNIDWLQGYWQVPTSPETNGALIYFFNGLEPQVNPASLILQPVLQYGVSPAGGGDYWAIAGWLVGSNTYASTLLVVNPGDLIIGTTYQTSASGDKLNYRVEAFDSTTSQLSTLSAWSSGIQWQWAFAGVLEAYNVTSCSQFPASGLAVFYDTSVAHGFPNYDYYGSFGFEGFVDNYAGHGGPACGFKATVSGGATVLAF